jgi:hypothetical protein
MRPAISSLIELSSTSSAWRCGAHALVQNRQGIDPPPITVSWKDFQSNLSPSSAFASSRNC